MTTESKDAGGNSPSVPRPEPLKGQAAGHPGSPFELLDELGQGARGSVYRARLRQPIGDVPAGTEVAIKFLRQEFAADVRAQAQLVAEGQVGIRIRSDHVVRIHAVRTMRALGLDVTYLVMELIAGQSLRRVLDASGSVVEELARRIGRDAARGLAAIHEQGLVHRDIKPENLALTDDGDVVVMDLGLVHEATLRGVAASGSSRRASSGSGFFGSLLYAAPEVLRGSPATPLSDLYALGIVLFEIVTGHHPFDPAPDLGRRDADSLIHAHLEQPPPRPSHFKPRLSAFLDQLILDLLAKDPDDRPKAAAELAATLARGENSRYWSGHERRAPRLASRRRLRAMRRTADAPFVGRRAERRALQRALRQASEGHGQAVFVSGPRNMGRRRLLDHWLGEVIERRDDLDFLGGEAKDGAGIQRAAPFAEMVLEWFLRGDRPDSPAVKTRLATRIAGTPAFDATTAHEVAAIACGADQGGSPEVRAALLAKALLALCPPEHTLVLRVDLFEQLSTTGRLVVTRLIETIRAQRVLLILVSIDGIDPPADCREIALQGLPQSDFLALARSLFADRQVDKALIRDAQRTLAGSPGNLIDTLADLRRAGQLQGAPGTYRITGALNHVPPPSSLLDRLEQRLAELPPPQRFVHLAAAVLGDAFRLDDLASVVGQNELSVLADLSVFQGRIIVTHRGMGRFRHRDFRRVMLRIAPQATRRRLHRTAAWTLEDRGAPRLEVGRQLSDADEHHAALAPLLDGLEHLTATGSRRSSLEVCDRIARHLRALPRRGRYLALRLRFLALRARVEELSDRPAAAAVTLRKAVCLAGVLDQSFTEADARTSLARHELARGRVRAALAELDAATELLRAHGQPKLRVARVLALRARIELHRGYTEAALQHGEDALGRLDGLPPDAFASVAADAVALRADLLVDLARIHTLRREFVVALRDLASADRLLAGTVLNLGRIRAQVYRGYLLAVLGSIEPARRLLTAASESATELQLGSMGAEAQRYLGELQLWQGHRAAAAEHFAAAASHATGDWITRVHAQVHLTALGRENLVARGEVEASGLTSLRIGLALATNADTSAALAKAPGVTLPLHMQRELLYRTGQIEAAEQLETDIAATLPRVLRRRFTQAAKRRPGLSPDSAT